MSIRKKNCGARKKTELPAGIRYRLVQRGNNRQPCFQDHTDFELYLKLWREKSRWYSVRVHAYCVTTNHIHFVVSSEETDAISNTMKVVGSCYAFQFNRRHGRSDTFCEGRHPVYMALGRDLDECAGGTVGYLIPSSATTRSTLFARPCATQRLQLTTNSVGK